MYRTGVALPKPTYPVPLETAKQNPRSSAILNSDDEHGVVQTQTVSCN
jgi:hypothetical protein